MVLRRAIRDAFTLAGIRVALFAGIYLAAMWLNLPGLGLLLWILNFWEFFGHNGSPPLGHVLSHSGYALIGLMVFLDTFVIVLLLSWIFRSLAQRSQGNVS
jgi:hypothetical protein